MKRKLIVIVAVLFGLLALAIPASAKMPSSFSVVVGIYPKIDRTASNGLYWGVHSWLTTDGRWKFTCDVEPAGVDQPPPEAPTTLNDLHLRTCINLDLLYHKFNCSAVVETWRNTTPPTWLSKLTVRGDTWHQSGVMPNWWIDDGATGNSLNPDGLPGLDHVWAAASIPPFLTGILNGHPRFMQCRTYWDLGGEYSYLDPYGIHIHQASISYGYTDTGEIAIPNF